MSQNNDSVYSIEPLSTELFIMPGETKEFEYEIKNKTGNILKVFNFGVKEDFIEMIIPPMNQISAFDSTKFTIRAKLPSSYDRNVGLRPNFVGIIEEWIE